MDSKTFIFTSALLAIAVPAAVYLYLFTRSGFQNPAEVSFENAKAALDRIKDWATWLSGLQTAALASMVLIAKNEKTGIALDIFQLWSGFFTLLLLGLSIILTTWTLSCLPSIQQHLVSHKSADNDIYCRTIFSSTKLKLGPFCGLSHGCCILGFVAFVLFVGYTVLKQPADEGGTMPEGGSRPVVSAEAMNK